MTISTRGGPTACVLGLSLFLLCGDAPANWSGYLTLASDYRYRGVSESVRAPVAQGGIGYDHRSGVFAGAFASSVRFDTPDTPCAKTIAYAGYAQRLSLRSSWEAGIRRFDYHGNRRTAWPYEEAYLGFTWERVTLRLHYTPDFFDLGIRQVYAETDLVLPLSERWALAAHVGYAAQSGNPPAADRADFRLGFGYRVDRLVAEAAVVGTDASQRKCPARRHHCDPGIELRVSLSF